MQVFRIQIDVYSLKDFIQRHPNEITPCSVGNTSLPNAVIVEESVEAPKFEEARRIECNILKGLISSGRRRDHVRLSVEQGSRVVSGLRRAPAKRLAERTKEWLESRSVLTTAHG